MGSTFSLSTLLKSPLSLFTADGGDSAAEWAETPMAYIIRVEVPRLKKDTVVADVVERDGYAMGLRISGQVKSSGKRFEKLVQLPENRGGLGGGLFYRSCVVHDGFILVTIPKVEEV